MIPLFVTVDTEGDNGWSRPKTITTENAKGIGRFQLLCEKYNIKPIYLLTYEMAMDDSFVSLLKKKNLAGKCEVGMHMHGWTTPPNYSLTENDFQYLPFITEYPDSIINEKVEYLTSLLQDRFDSAVISHRSGRWAVNNVYLQILVDNGYKVDCSFTPLIDWSCSYGNPKGNGGPDYSHSPTSPHIINLPKGSIMEIPMTTMRNRVYDNIFVNSCLKVCPRQLKTKKIYNAINGRKVVMLRPDIRKEHIQLRLINHLKFNRSLEHIELMIHSSEVYKGTSPHCSSDTDLNELYRIMDKMFYELSLFCEPMTFKEYLKTHGEK